MGESFYRQYAAARLPPRIQHQWRKGHPASSVRHKSYCHPEFRLPTLQQMLGLVLLVGRLYMTQQSLVRGIRYAGTTCPWPARLRQKVLGCPEIESCPLVV